MPASRWTHRIQTIDGCGRVPLPIRYSALHGRLSGRRWELRADELGSVHTDDRRRLRIPAGVRAVLRLTPGGQVVVSSSAEHKVLVLWAAECLDDVLSGMSDVG